VDRLIGLFRGAGQSVGVVAVDPTSPFSGGAVLGDRIRMQAHTLDPGVFIRSMATRGSLGGLSRATADVQRLLDAAGFEWVLVETVGVGQSELEVASLADTTVVVLVPESGDGIQTMKAGLLEVADLFVVNKADREGAGRLATELRHMAHVHREGQQGSRDLDWEVPVLLTSGRDGSGLDELAAVIRRHREALAAGDALRRRRERRRARELGELVVAGLRADVERALAASGALAGLRAEVEAGRLDPYTARAEALVRLRAAGGTLPV
jgi:LAO/AO transport system kinase